MIENNMLENILNKILNGSRNAARSLVLGTAISLVAFAGCGKSDDSLQEIEKVEKSKIEKTEDYSKAIINKWLGTDGEIIEFYNKGVISLSSLREGKRTQQVGEYTFLDTDTVKTNFDFVSSIFDIKSLDESLMTISKDGHQALMRRYIDGPSKLIVKDERGNETSELTVLAEEGIPNVASPRPVFSIINDGPGIACYSIKVPSGMKIEYEEGNLKGMEISGNWLLHPKQDVRLNLSGSLPRDTVEKHDTETEYRDAIKIFYENGLNNPQKKSLAMKVRVTEQAPKKITLNMWVKHGIKNAASIVYSFDAKKDESFVINTKNNRDLGGGEELFNSFYIGDKKVEHVDLSSSLIGYNSTAYLVKNDQEGAIKMKTTRARDLEFKVCKVKSFDFEDGVKSGDEWPIRGITRSVTFRPKAGKQYFTYNSEGNGTYITTSEEIDKLTALDMGGRARWEDYLHVIKKNMLEVGASVGKGGVWNCEEEKIYTLLLLSKGFKSKSRVWLYEVDGDLSHPKE